MSRKFLVPVLLVAQVVVVLLLATVSARQPAASASGAAALQDRPQEQFAAANGLYLWSYAAKFVCGYQRTATPGQPAVGEPTVKPGNYATEINIHNPTYKPVLLHKKFLVLVNAQQLMREPQQTEPRRVISMTLGADMAMMDDCNNLWAITFPGAPLPSPMPVFIGYLVILSPLELDIDAAYTANVPGDLAATPTGISIDVQRVTGKRVFVPAGALP